MQQISVIIPTWNEEENIEKLIDYLWSIPMGREVEIMVIDGGSTDKTVEILQKKGVEVKISPRKGRAAQLNYGASLATGNILHFIHADTLPPASCFLDVLEALGEGYDLGCFTYEFDSKFPLLKLNGFFTRFDIMWCRGGDQTLFIKKEVFEDIGRFREDYVIMEDFEILKRARKKYAFKIIKKNAIISDRKYKKNSYMRVQVANLIAFNMFRFGYAPQKIADTYQKLLK